MSATPVVIAIGSNLGPRDYLLRRAIHELGRTVRVVRQSPIIETLAIDAPHGSPDFLNMIIAGVTRLTPDELLAGMHEIEARLGRVRRVRNGPRTIDLDLILYGAVLRRGRTLTLPHPRYRERNFVLAPLQELNLGWTDPATGRSIDSLGRTVARKSAGISGRDYFVPKPPP